MFCPLNVMYVLHVVLRINSNTFLNGINPLIFTMKTPCVLYDVGTELINIT
jgi:hypothetical protein